MEEAAAASKSGVFFKIEIDGKPTHPIAIKLFDTVVPKHRAVFALFQFRILTGTRKRTL